MKNLLFALLTSVSLYSYTQQCKIYTSTSKDFVALNDDIGTTYEIRRAFEADGAFNTDLEVYYTVSGSAADYVNLESGSAIIPSGKSYVEIPIILDSANFLDNSLLIITITPNVNYTISNDIGIDKGIISIPVLDEVPLKAFPTAYGPGAYSKGGRGGNVYHVTKLNDDGSEGTYRWALEQPRPATIVFDVSGIIVLEQSLIEPYNDLTIAGQTAPAGGITLTTDGGIGQNNAVYSIDIRGESDDFIMRYFKVRPQLGGDGMGIYSNFGTGRNIIIDHCSFSWANNASFSVRGNLTENITLQRNIFAESKVGNLFGDSQQHEYSGNLAAYNNLWYNTSHRVPNSGANGRVDNINNFIHNWRFRMSFINGDNRYNHINNYYSAGSITSIGPNYWGNARPINQLNSGNSPDAYENTPYDYEVYTSGNIVSKGIHGITDDNKLLWGEFDLGNQRDLAPDYVFTDSQHSLLGASLPIKTADEINTEVRTNPNLGANASLNGDGSVIRDWDFIDDEYLAVLAQGEEAYEDYTTSSTAENRSHYYTPRFNNFVASISTTPINTRPDNFYNPEKSEHIPEEFYDLFMPEGASHNDIAPSGYTWLEEYLNQVDADDTVAAIGVESVAVTPNPAELQITNTLQLTATFTPSNATNQNGTWTSSDEDIATVDANGLVTPVSIGEVTISFTTEDGGFTDTSEITVFPEALNPSAGDDQQICEGESITLTASGGTSYVWSTGETNESIEVTPEETTSYTVTVSDDFEQSEEVSVTVIVNPIPIANAGEDQSICEGDTATLTATGGNSYLWSTGETTASIEVSPTEETSYSVEVSNSNCSSVDDIIVFVNTAPQLVISEDTVIVEGASATLNVSGSDTYEWSTGETSESITVNPIVTTNYTVSSIGPNGCSSNAEVTVTVIPEVVANAGEDVTICSGESVTLTALGGSNYTWNTGDLESELTVNPTETTTYTVTVEDDYGYTDTDEVTVFVNEIPTITINNEVFIMVGNTATLTASGGNTYFWNTGETTSEISVSPEVTTTYTVTGVSENGCQNTAEVIVNVIEELNANAGEDTSICLGESITLSASGGITYTWNTGDTGASPTFTPTESTTYTVTVTDDFGNTDTDEVTITVNPVPIANAGEDVTTCEGESVTLTAEGGDSYLWSTGATTQSISVNPEEDTTYSVEVFTNSCSDIDEVTVFVSPKPDLTVSEEIVIVVGSATTIEVSGADTYLWSNGETSSSIEVSPSETTTYSVTGFLASGCQITEEITVTVLPEVNANAGNDVSICIGETVILNATGGQNYEWSTGEASASISDNPTETTTYTVTVFDDFGNSDSDSVTVTVDQLPSLTITDDITILEGESTNLSVSGAESYQWSTGETSSTITVSPLETTTYNVAGFSVNGCEAIEEVTVNVVAEVDANAGNDVSICIGETVTLNASGGSNYEWSTGETTASITVNPSETTTYTVTVYDDFGNSDSDSVTVTVNALPSISVSEDITIVEGESTSLSVNGAETYLWSTGDTSSSITVSPTQTTTYNVIGITNSCSSELVEVTVTVEALFQARAGNDERVCDNESYEVILTANQGDSYLWSTGETTQSISVSPLSTTTYSVTVSLGEQSDSDEVMVYVDPSPEVVIANGDSVEILNGDFVTLSASGANRYEWSNGATQPNVAVSPSSTTTYEVKGFIGECYDDKQVTVNVLQPVVADAGEDVMICVNDVTTLTASGGDDYVWSTGETTETIEVSPTETTEYTVTAFNALDFDEATVRVEVDLNCAIDSNGPIEDDTELSFDIYPNPASDLVNVKITGALNVSDINIYDVTGKLVKHSKITNENLSYTTTTQISVNSFQSGVYFVKLIDKDKVITKKLIID
ncbi:Ig-like domain-containing protein [Winogradskyella sp. SM1960]|uniref:Ig-like domain-containing protein n=1 Tax=Winogradskyella sp. SM1960 TaxID=2865955 RepID=UPI001CD564FF|nr:Ig-like domain-containing protein [Winogradskyella sp. SM1960]